MAVALKVGVGDLLAEFLAHALVFLCPRKPARAINGMNESSVLHIEDLDAGDDLLVLVQPDLHSASSSFLSASFSR